MSGPTDSSQPIVIDTTDVHQMHFLQTMQSLNTIRNNITFPEEHEITPLMIDLPNPWEPKTCNDSK